MAYFLNQLVLETKLLLGKTSLFPSIPPPILSVCVCLSLSLLLTPLLDSPQWLLCLADSQTETWPHLQLFCSAAPCRREIEYPDVCECMCICEDIVSV